MLGFGKRKQLQQELDATRRELAEIKNQSATFSITDSAAWQEFFGQVATAAGPVVTPETAMRVSAVFACVRLIGGAVASAQIKTYRRTDADGRTLAQGHPLEQVLRLRPNRFMTAGTFWRTMLHHKLLQGNAYAHIVRNGLGDPVALFPLKPRQVATYWAWELGLDSQLGVERNRLFYQCSFDDGTMRTYDQADMLHIPNVGWDGKRGLSTIQAAAQGLGLAMAAEESAARIFRNGLLSQVALTYPVKLSQDALDRLREHVQAKLAGAENHHKPLILTEGGDAKALSMSAEDAQLLDSRQFGVIDICRFFGVPPVMIGETEKTSSWGSGVEQMARWFTMFTLNDHLTAIEQELEVKLFGDGHFAEFDETELTRGDTKTRGEFYQRARGSLQEPGYMTINEIRAAEGLPPVAGGDELMRPDPAAAGKAQGQKEKTDAQP